MSKQKDPNICPLCGEFIEVRCTGFAENPFIDSQTYSVICQYCFEVPKMYEFSEEEKEFLYFKEFDPRRLHTVEEMASQGFDKKLAAHSIKSVKSSIKRHLKV